MGKQKLNNRIKVQTTVMCSERDIADLLVTAFEGGSNYWIESIKSVRIDSTKDSIRTYVDGEQYPWYASFPLNKTGKVIIIAEDDTEAQRVLDRASIEKGLQLMAQKSPKHFADFIDKSYDATTGDVFLQLALFREVVFG